MSQLSTVREVFNLELSPKFTASEIKLIYKTCASKRLNLSLTELMFAKDIDIQRHDTDYFQSIIDRLLANEPFQYIIGSTEFYGLELLCDKRALIPRPETEELVDWIVNSIDTNLPVKVADVCAGSGCIALALKSTLPLSIIHALEFSDNALSLIEENTSFTDLKLEILKFDALGTQYDSLESGYSIIVSNPPYIPLEDEILMHSNVLDHEPRMALFVENDSPFVFYKKISENGYKLLKDEGWIYYEVHENLAEGVKDIMSTNGFVNIEVRKDLQGKERMIRGQKLPSRHE